MVFWFDWLANTFINHFNWWLVTIKFIEISVPKKWKRKSTVQDGTILNRDNNLDFHSVATSLNLTGLRKTKHTYYSEKSGWLPHRMKFKSSQRLENKNVAMVVPLFVEWQSRKFRRWESCEQQQFKKIWIFWHCHSHHVLIVTMEMAQRKKYGTQKRWNKNFTKNPLSNLEAKITTIKGPCKKHRKKRK